MADNTTHPIKGKARVEADKVGYDPLVRADKIKIGGNKNGIRGGNYSG